MTFDILSVVKFFNPSVVKVFLFRRKCDTKGKKTLPKEVCILKIFSSIDKNDEIDKN